MDWMNVVNQLFEIVIFPLLFIGGLYLISLIKTYGAKKRQEENNELFNKYSKMLEETIIDCVLATTQTYVSSLKKAGKFDKEAQKTAFKMTYENVMTILTDDAKEFLQSAIGDLEVFVKNKIEAEVLLNK